MNTADTLPFSSTTNNLTGAFSAESRHVFVIFTLLSELDVPDEGLLSAGKRSNKNGNRIGTIVNADNAETCAQYAKKIAMQKPSFLLPIWNNVAATAADDAPQGSDVDILLHFGDGSKSKVHIRHVENKSSNDPIILLELSIATKVLIGNDSCVVESKDVLYEHASLAMHGKPEEFYIYPSSKVSNFLYCSDLTKEAVGSNANESTDNVLILFEDDSIKQIQQNVDTRTTLELMDEDRSVRKVDAVVSNNNTNANANANANTKTKTNTSKQETMTGKGQDVVTSKKKDRKRKVMQTQQDDEISIEKEETLGGKNQDVVTPTKKGRKRKVMQTQQDDEIIHDTKETPSKDNSTSKKIRSIDQSPKPSVKTPSKKSKSKKDKNEPKRAPSAYILFCNDKRAGIIEDNPNVDPVDIMKKMGELWRAAGDDVKAKYAEKSKKLSAIANEKIQAYRKVKQENVDQEADSGGEDNDNDKSEDEKPKAVAKKSKSKKDKNEPKRAPSAYILFCNDKRAGIIKDNPNVDPVDIMKKMGELWRAAGDDVKAKYAEKSKKLSAIANEKIQAYRKVKQENVDQEADSDGEDNDNDKSEDEKPKAVAKKTKSKKDKNEPKRAPSAYILFCNDKRAGIIEDNPNVDPVDIMKKMGELWRAAGDDVKAKYAEKSKKLSTIANEKIQAYRKDKQEASQVDREHDSDGGENDNEKSKKSKSKQKRKKAESDGTVVEKKQKKSKKSKSK